MKGHWKARFGGRVQKRGLEEGHRKVKLGQRAPESKAWMKDAGKQGLDEGCWNARLRGWALESKA